MPSPIHYFSSQYSTILAGKTSLQTKSKINQVCEVRLIPGLELFCLREYGPLSWLLGNKRIREVGAQQLITKVHLSLSLLPSNQDKGCTLAYSLALPYGTGLLNVSILFKMMQKVY